MDVHIDLPEFTRPWMRYINQDLLYRYWVYKGCPGKLTRYTYGVKLVSVGTLFGVLTFRNSNTSKLNYLIN